MLVRSLGNFPKDHFAVRCAPQRASPMAEGSENATLLLHRLDAGESQAAEQLLPLLYDELKAIARRQFRGQPDGHTLQATVLVHEAFLRLVGRPASSWKDRKHFFAVAATAMRQIL